MFLFFVVFFFFFFFVVVVVFYLLLLLFLLCCFDAQVVLVQVIFTTDRLKGLFLLLSLYGFVIPC